MGGGRSGLGHCTAFRWPRHCLRSWDDHGVPSSAARLSDRVQSAVVRGLAGLPDGFLRLITGRPVSVDGQQLHPETQLGLKLLELAGTPPLQELTPAEARDRVAHDARTFEGPKIQ